MAENERWTLGGLIEVIRADRQMSKKKRDELVAIAESIATPSAYPVVAVEPAQPVEAVEGLAAALNQCADDLLDEDGPSSFSIAERLHELAAFQGAALAHPRPAGDSWTCFHCSETITDRAEAALHFGTHESQHPACAIDVAAHRAMEAKEARYFDEDADIHRQMHRMAHDHQLALRRAEEAGYAKALKDAGYTATTGEQAGEVVGRMVVHEDPLVEANYGITSWEQEVIAKMPPGEYPLYAQPRPVGVPDGWTVERGPDLLGQSSMRVTSPNGEEQLYGIFRGERLVRDFLMAAFPIAAEVPTP